MFKKAFFISEMRGILFVRKRNRISKILVNNFGPAYKHSFSDGPEDINDAANTDEQRHGMINNEHRQAILFV